MRVPGLRDSIRLAETTWMGRDLYARKCRSWPTSSGLYLGQGNRQNLELYNDRISAFRKCIAASRTTRSLVLKSELNRPEPFLSRTSANSCFRSRPEAI